MACRPFLWDLARRESTTLSGIIDMETASSILTRASTWCCTATALFEVPLVACFKAACACCRVCTTPTELLLCLRDAFQLPRALGSSELRRADPLTLLLLGWQP